MLWPVTVQPLPLLSIGGLPGVLPTLPFGWGVPQFQAPTVTPTAPKDLVPLSKAFSGQLDRPLSLAKNYDKLARELATRDPQLLAVITPYKLEPNATFTIARARTATAGGPEFSETIRISAGPKAATGGPGGTAPTGADISFNFATLGLTVVIDQLLATKIQSPYKRAGVMLGTMALASRISTGNWTQGKSALEGFVKFNFYNEVTTSFMEMLGVKDPKALAYGSVGITAATMLAHQYMNRGADLALKGVETIAESRGLAAALPKLAGKALWVLQILDIGGGIAEDIKYDKSDNRTAIYLNFEHDEMRDRTPTGLKWTTNFSIVRWPMRWFGGADEAADRKADEYIAAQVIPQLNDIASATEGLLLSSAAKAVKDAQLEMVDPCLEQVAEHEVNPNYKITKTCTVAGSNELLRLRQKELSRVGVLSKGKVPFADMDATYWTDEPWKTEGVWDESDESLRFQFWEHLAKWTGTSFFPDLQLNPDDMSVFRTAHIWNGTVSKLDAAKPWNDITSFINADGKITDHRAFGEYLKEPVRKRCDQVASGMTGDFLAMAERCFAPDGSSFDREKFADLVAAYYRAPNLQPGIEEFYDLLVIDSVHGGNSKGQEIAGVVDAHGKIKDMDNLVVFLMKAFHDRNAHAEGDFRQVLKESGLNADLAAVTDPATGAVTIKTDKLTPAIEQSIRDKGGDEIARNMLLYPAREDSLYMALRAPISREWVDRYVTGISPTPGV